MSTSYVQNYIFSQAKGKVMSQTQGLYPAPLRILDVCIYSIYLKSKKSIFSLSGSQTNSSKWFKSWI
jgi:hypothetical protein